MEFAEEKQEKWAVRASGGKETTKFIEGETWAAERAGKTSQFRTPMNGFASYDKLNLIRNI